MNILLENRAACCGCAACAQICPKKAISMESDREGFQYPVVDKELCVSCGLCRGACPMEGQADGGGTSLSFLEHYPDIPAPVVKKNGKASTRGCFHEPRAFGGMAKDEGVLERSSSGGIFTILAEKILTGGGVVFGAAFSGDWTVRHVAVTDKEGLSALRGSKYVQSEIGRVYEEAREYLLQGREVLFSGTPCQTAGLRSFLGRDEDKLYLVDFICHGVPSPMVFSKYLDYVRRKEGAEISSFRFRLKDHGWHPSGLQMGTEIAFDNGRVLRHFPAFRDPYMNGFLADLYLRPSCYNCPFKTIPKGTADITIADFWGVDKIMPDVNYQKGASLVLAHNPQGMKLLESIGDSFEGRECNWEKSVRKNQTLLRSAAEPLERADFFELLEKSSFEKAARKYLGTGRAVLEKAGRIGWGMVEKLAWKLFRILPFIPGRRAASMQDDAAFSSFMQFVRFCVVGLSNVIVSYGVNVSVLLIISAFGGMEYDYVIANIAAFFIAVYWSFSWNSRKVFRLKEKGRAERAKVLAKTYICYAFTGIVLNNLLATLWIRGLGISKFISPLLNLFITVPINFITNKYWAYAKSGEKEGRSGHEGRRIGRNEKLSKNG